MVWPTLGSRTAKEQEQNRNCQDEPLCQKDTSQKSLSSKVTDWTHIHRVTHTLNRVLYVDH